MRLISAFLGMNTDEIEMRERVRKRVEASILPHFHDPSTGLPHAPNPGPHRTRMDDRFGGSHERNGAFTTQPIGIRPTGPATGIDGGHEDHNLSL